MFQYTQITCRLPHRAAKFLRMCHCFLLPVLCQASCHTDCNIFASAISSEQTFQECKVSAVSLSLAAFSSPAWRLLLMKMLQQLHRRYPSGCCHISVPLPPISLLKPLCWFPEWGQEGRNLRLPICLSWILIN